MKSLASLSTVLALLFCFSGCGGKASSRRDSGGDVAKGGAEVNDGRAAVDGPGKDGAGVADVGDLAVDRDVGLPADAGADVVFAAEVEDVADTSIAVEVAADTDGPVAAEAAKADDAPATSDAAAEDAAAEVSAVPQTECFDNNPCTLDTVEGLSCRHSPLPDGTLCSDGNACTLGDTCQAGLCVSGTAQHAALGELGRIEAFGSESGVVIPTGDGRLLFVDPAYPKTILHTVAFDKGVLSVLGTEYPRPDQPSAFLAGNPSATTAMAGWPGYAAFGWNGGYTVNLVTLDASGKPTVHTRFELPLASGFLAGDLNGLAGYQSTLWACINYSFFGPPSGALLRYDLSDPDAPVLAQSVNLPAGCGSTVVSQDGKRVYVNTTGGVYWFDPAQTDTSGNVIVNGPFGTNSGLAMVGAILMARGSASLVLYNESDRTELFHVDQAGLVGAAYLPDQDVLVLMRQEQKDGGYERWLQLNDARFGGTGAVLDQVLLDRSQVTATRIPSSEDVVMDFRSKAAFRVVAGKLVRQSLPMLGGLGTLAASTGSLAVWSPISWRALDISDVAHPSWKGQGGPIIGRARALGLDVGAEPPVLVNDPGYGDGSSTPTAGRVALGSSSAYAHEGDALVLALRDGKTWAQSTDVGKTLLPGVEYGMMEWSSDSLFRVSSPATGQLRLRRWDRSQLASATPPAPREDLTFSLGALPIAWMSGSLLDFPEHGNVGLVASSYSLALDGSSSYGATLFWLDRSTPTMRVLDQVQLDGLQSSVVDCRVSDARTVCAAGSELLLIEHAAKPGLFSVHRLPSDASDATILAFDGQTIYIAKDDGLEAVSFATLLAWQAPDGGASVAADGGLPNATRISFTSRPLSMIEKKDALVVSSSYEVVTLRPACLGR